MVVVHSDWGLTNTEFNHVAISFLCLHMQTDAFFAHCRHKHTTCTSSTSQLHMHACMCVMFCSRLLLIYRWLFKESRIYYSPTALPSLWLCCKAVEDDSSSISRSLARHLCNNHHHPLCAVVILIANISITLKLHSWNFYICGEECQHFSQHTCILLPPCIWPSPCYSHNI